MIQGIGIDQIEVERIAAKIEKKSGFRELVFSKTEIEYCESKLNKYEHYAARFAAKEAFYKALGTGFLAGTSFNEIEIKNEENGKPVLILKGDTEAIIRKMGPFNISVSLSHLKLMGSAVVIIEHI